MHNSTIEILLVEDNMNDAELTIRALRKNKIVNNIIHLKDGEEALNFLFGTGSYTGRDISILPKLILLDVKMPKVDGIEALRKIKSDDIMKKIPVVMLTSSKEHPDIESSYLLGANSYIVKPVEFDGFMKAVSELGLYWILLNQPPVS
jgi:two-component system response regulator